MSATQILIIGNIISLIGCLIMVGVGFLKKKNQILLVQIVQFFFMGVGNWILGGFSGLVSNFVEIFRNAIGIKREFTTPFKVFFIAIQVIITVFVNDMGLIGWFPVIATCIFTWCMDSKSEVLLKTLIIIAQLMWAFYDFNLVNYAALTFDLLTVLSNLIGIVMIRMDKGTEKVPVQE